MKNTDEKKSQYFLLRDAYYGMGGFDNGSYLAQHPRENNKKYESRKQRAYYLNYTKPCVDAHVDPIFQNSPQRDWKGAASALWDRFVRDTDFAGSSLDNLMKRAAQMTKLYGVSFVVLDKEKDILSKTEWTIADFEKNRNNIPYAFLVEPARVVEIKIDKFGRIVLFAYLEKDYNDETKTNTRTLTVHGWELREGSGVLSGKVIEKGTYRLGSVPVVAIFSRESDNEDYFPPSEFLAIAKTNMHIYNACSWRSEILSGQTFPLLIYPTTAKTDLELGTDNALGFSPESKHSPNYIAPPDGPAEMLGKEIDFLRQECYRMAGVVNVTGVTSTQSGVAKAWDFKRTNQTLATFSGILGEAELQIAQIFSAWVGLEVELSVSYPSDFSYSDIDAELSNAIVAKDLDFGEGFNTELFKRVLTAYLPELSAERFDELVEEYKNIQIESSFDKEQIVSTVAI